MSHLLAATIFVPVFTSLCGSLKQQGDCHEDNLSWGWEQQEAFPNQGGTWSWGWAPLSSLR